MATHELHKFLVYAPDKIDDGTYALRLSVRETHLVNAKQWMAEKFLLVGGAMLTPESLTTPENKKMIGSSFVCQAKNTEEVLEKIKSDVYFTFGVWDPDKIVVVPYVTITPFP
ncbi:hypothetical protein GGX14DRAFT_566092 [Mycena pura]|uniref:YCII-related domain-containing protein n=1 Tax=Mycena pura TaxID=153505 RepID=A0AAD6VH62_9AGAR|nr:hypothetical protein GGX14DRAFT_566092 [Mycena pura]